jgi:hypothetical protein
MRHGGALAQIDKNSPLSILASAAGSRYPEGFNREMT